MKKKPVVKRIPSRGGMATHRTVVHIVGQMKNYLKVNQLSDRQAITCYYLLKEARAVMMKRS